MSSKTGKHINVGSLGELAGCGISSAAVAIGVFDGLHLGHRHLLDRLKDMASRNAATPVVLTFFPHPREVLKPDEPLYLLVPQEKKIELMHAYGIKAVVTFPFTVEFSRLSPDNFLEECLTAPEVGLRGICVGQDWRFGAGGRGDTETIRKFTERRKIDFAAVKELKLDGKIISSTAIRRAVSGGLLDLASRMLGRHYSLTGAVVHGENIAGTVLGCPTANLLVPHGIIPPKGVYAGYALVHGRKHKAAISVGTAPTFKHKSPDKLLIEAHILGFDGSIYGDEVELEFVRYVREERCFSSKEALKDQIGRDIELISRILGKNH